MVFLSIVIPAFNEERRLPKTLNQIIGYLAGSRPNARATNTEILVVDDGSSDATAETVARIARLHPQVGLLRNSGNRGKGYSVRHGMLHAKGEWILFTDADLSAPIEELEKLFRAAEKQEAAVAIGSRALDRKLIGVHQSWARENAGRVFNLCMRAIVGLNLWDTQCGFKLFRRDAARAVFSRQRLDGFGFDVEALYIAHRLGYKIAEVPVRWNHVEGTKVDLFGDSARMFADLFRIRWNAIRGRYSQCDTGACA
ncbi:MAG: glycosyltransferase family 2 protein [Gammaproteobacteria bacterium]|nr:glycosyltransferase family 2 protein [Gammaproteobacteria bacterium]